MAAISEMWPLRGRPENSHVGHSVSQKQIYVMRIHSKRRGSSDVITEQKTLDNSCFSLTILPPPPSQLLTSNLVTNILFAIHQIN